MLDGEDKVCFIIAPIGEPGSSTRERSDLVLEHIIQPALDPYGYKALRADNIDRPGIITTQVIQHVLDAPLVIADLTERNPNVFYELAIRHITRKPFIQIIQEGEGIPFDVAATRLITVDHNHLGRAAEARDKIKAQIKSLEADPEDLETPISTSVDLQRLRQSDAPQDRLLMDSVSTLVRSELSNFAELVNFRSTTTQQEIQSAISEAFSNFRGPERGPTERNIRAVLQITRQSSTAHGFLILLSLFRERVPWVYELGAEAYRKTVEDDYQGARQIFRELLQSMDSMSSFIPRDLMSVRNDLEMQFEQTHLPF